MLHYITASHTTNLGDYVVVSKTPAECSDEEIESFANLLIEGGEVAAAGVIDRVKRAKVLGFAYTSAHELIAVSALKIPYESYRANVEQGSGASIPKEDFPYEVGWLYMKPEYRGGRAGQTLRFLLVQPCLGISGGAFATVRNANLMPQRLMDKFGFERKGGLWTSSRNGSPLALFVRDADKGVLQSVASADSNLDYEVVYMSKVLASVLDETKANAKLVRVPALAQTIALAASAGYAKASTDLAIAVASEDGELAAHALNFIHTETQSDIKKLDPELKIIGDVVPAESVGVIPPNGGISNQLGMLFQLATSLPAARKDLDIVELGNIPSLPHVCKDHLAGLGCPHMEDIHEMVETPKPSLDINAAREVLTKIDSDLRSKLADADDVESDRLQRILINLETLMAELIGSGMALASEYVPFGEVTKKASSIRIVGIRNVKGKIGVFEILTHFLDGTILKSVASNKRSLGLCLGQLKVGTKVNFQGEIGRTTEDGITLRDGRDVSFVAKSIAPVEATAGSDDMDNEATAGNQVDFYNLFKQINEHYADDSRSVRFEFEKRIGTYYYVPFIADESQSGGESKTRPVTREECINLEHEVNDLLKGSMVTVRALDRPTTHFKQEWALHPQAYDGAMTPKLPKEAARTAWKRSQLADLGDVDATASFFESAIATASTASDRLYAKIAEKVQSNRPGLKSASATVTEMAGTIIIVIQDVVLQPEALSTILNKPIKTKTKSFVRASGVEFDVETFPGRNGKAGDVSIKFDRSRPRQVTDALGTLRRLFDTAVSYGKSPADLEATATADIADAATRSIASSIGRLVERARNMYEAIAILADQEAKQGTLVEIPLKLKYEIAKSFESMHNVETLVYRQLDQDKATIEVSFKSLSREEAKAVAAKFIPTYKDRKVTAFRTALFTVADAFGSSKPRAVGDIAKLAATLRPACDLLEAGKDKAVGSSEVTASVESDLALVVFPQTLLGMEIELGAQDSYRTQKSTSYYYGSSTDADHRQLNVIAWPKSSSSDEIGIDLKLYGRSRNYTAHYDKQVPRCLGTATAELGKTVEETTHNIEEAARKLLDETSGNLGPNDPKPMTLPFWAKDHNHMLKPLR